MRWSKWVMWGIAGTMLAGSLSVQASEKQTTKHSAVPVPEAKTEDLYAGNSLKRWMPKAEHGDIFAQYVLGHMYCVGQGVPKDMAKGLSWYQRAADQGFAPGQLALGTMYYNGEGVKQDYTLAAKWFRLAAERGYDRAQSNLAAMYMNGTGVPQDYTQAVKWFRAAANQGYATAQYSLGRMYSDGTGMSKPDVVAAYGLLRPLVEKGNSAAVAAMKELLPKMNPDQIKKGQELAEQIRGKNRLDKALGDYEKVALR
ncbi:tetratricopeptide repeat protein [Halothiobacillus sp.]|uniref:tetratricopeptide repeat protein n=1 Tax=Halothiobacillus sp. TaxID=1891311 RepID=UPI00260F094C|nr:tetratricopeptide repeat protein [Halothiobacillus sp.]